MSDLVGNPEDRFSRVAAHCPKDGLELDNNMLKEDLRIYIS